MTCQDGGCPTHVFNQANAPTAADDPCNSSGNGFFCQGSWWHTTETGCDGNDVDVLYLRIGGTCNVDEWIQISSPASITSNVAPVDGTDCCPAGSIWTVPAGSIGNEVPRVYVSSGEDTCTWCLICGRIEERELIALPAVTVPTPLTVLPVFTEIEPFQCFTYTNNTGNRMEVEIYMSNVQINIANFDIIGGIVRGRYQWSFDGGVTWNGATRYDDNIELAPVGNFGANRNLTLGSNFISVVVDPGAVIDFCYRRLIATDNQMNNALIIVDATEIAMTFREFV